MLLGWTQGNKPGNQMMYGIEPDECIYCGETPEFIMPTQSIDWPSEIPVKGIDGQEYKICPSCNDDMMEVTGERLGQWGWKISCLECGWEIKQAELLDIQQYRGFDGTAEEGPERGHRPDGNRVGRHGDEGTVCGSPRREGSWKNVALCRPGVEQGRPG